MCCAIVCALYSISYFCFDCDQLCKAWETPICGDSSQLGYWYKEENRDTQIWSLDHFRGVECNPWPKEFTINLSRHWLNHDKNRCVSCPFYSLRSLSSCVLILTCNIAPKLVLILKEQSSEEFSFLLPYSNLVSVLTNIFQWNQSAKTTTTHIFLFVFSFVTF